MGPLLVAAVLYCWWTGVQKEWVVVFVVADLVLLAVVLLYPRVLNRAYERRAAAFAVERENRQREWAEAYGAWRELLKRLNDSKAWDHLTPPVQPKEVGELEMAFKRFGVGLGAPQSEAQIAKLDRFV